MDIAILGDIHGCSNALKGAINYIRRKGINKIFCVGDCISRGPDSRGVIEQCIDYKIIAVRGNHEDTFLNKVSSDSASNWSLLEDELRRLDKPELIDYISSMPYFALVGTVLITHAGLPMERLQALFTLSSHLR